jgi:hypothetical protein
MVNVKLTSREVKKRLESLEKLLKPKLEKFYNQKINGSLSPIELLKRKYETQVFNNIRSTVQKSYIIGMNLVIGQMLEINKEFEPFISVTDANNIRDVTKETSDRFWKTASKLHNRESEFILTPDKKLQLKHQFDTTAAMIGVASRASFNGYNSAVKSKTSVLTVPVQRSLAGQFEDFDTINQIKGSVMFLTARDSKVDPEICEPLDGTIYDSHDTDIPNPPLHNFCRCILLPILGASKV